MMSIFIGKKLVAITTLITLLLVAGATLYADNYVAGLPYIIKPTAHAAFVFFWLAFTASSLHRLFPSGYSRWAMKNRRYIGLSFAAIHGIHAVLVLSNITLTDESRPILVFLVGTMAYVFLGLMAVTSNNKSVSKLGVKNWQRLHRTGSWYIWIIFISGAPAAIIDGNIPRIIMSVMCVAALMLRITVYRKMQPNKTAD